VVVTASTAQRREQGARLKALRVQLGISKVAICTRFGWESTQTYDLYERGVSAIRFDAVDDWAAAFGISPEAFVGVILGTRAPAEVTATTATPGA